MDHFCENSMWTLPLTQNRGKKPAKLQRLHSGCVAPVFCLCSLLTLLCFGPVITGLQPATQRQAATQGEQMKACCTMATASLSWS